MKKFYTCVLALAIFVSVTNSQTIKPEFPFTNGIVLTIAKYGNTIYIGGMFTSVLYASGASYPRNHLAAFDATTGAILPWNPEIGRSLDFVRDLQAGNNLIYLAGEDNIPRAVLAAVDPVTGATTWHPDLGFTRRSNIYKIIITNTRIYAGGAFEFPSPPYGALAVFDAATGALVTLHKAGSNVFDMALKDNSLYVGGDFVTLDQVTRYYIGAIDINTAAVLSWNPAANSSVRSLRLKGNILYAGGEFTSIGSLPRNRMAALDAATGAVLPWDPRVEGGRVGTIEVSGNNVYMGVALNSKVGGQPRNYLAAADAVTGTVSIWNPNPNNEVYTILDDGNTVFVGGIFSTIAGQPRSYFAALTAPPSAPVITCPGNITVSNAAGICGQTVPLNATATGFNPFIFYRINNTNIFTSSYAFPVGTTTVTAIAANTIGSSSCTFTVTVNDTQAPTITSPSPSIRELWPANHKMKDVWIDYSVSDNCPGVVSTQLSVSSNEPSNGDDWKIIDNHHLQLKAERLGNGSGRIYTITVTATDQYGNTSSKSTTVAVPHDQSSKSMNVRSSERLSGSEEVLVKVQSNPSHNYFTLTTQSAMPEQRINLRLYDISGRLLEVKNVTAGETVQIGKALSAGVYVLEYNQGSTIRKVKVVKQ